MSKLPELTPEMEAYMDSPEFKEKLREAMKEAEAESKEREKKQQKQRCRCCYCRSQVRC